MRSQSNIKNIYIIVPQALNYTVEIDLYNNINKSLGILVLTFIQYAPRAYSLYI